MNPYGDVFMYRPQWRCFTLFPGEVSGEPILQKYDRLQQQPQIQRPYPASDNIHQHGLDRHGQQLLLNIFPVPG